uniref:Ubiquitin carboxyl-terminal hydrolase 8-like n=1 Tax=Crassostrea virginica TaxID=6565 RepID=A0A8B8ALJ8_CRAVI|nr:ubiquitin carboxyl-terminal hydrolase 8-like [Crassostrea virginica]
METSVPVGLPSVGQTCYASCMLQVLRNTDPFVKFLEKHAPEKDSFSDILLEILKNKNKDISELKQDICHLLVFLESIDETFNRNCSNDCASFLHVLLDALGRDDDMKGNIDLFFVEVFDEIECGDCMKVDELDMQRILGIHSTANIFKVLNMDNLHEELIEKGSLKCNHCQEGNKLLKRSKLCSCPPLLMVQIQRITHRENGFIKSTDPFEFDLTLNVQGCREENRIEETYELYAVVYHVGDLEGGHYFCAVKHHLEWYICDNDRVCKSEDLQEVLNFKEAYILLYQWRPREMSL